MSELAVPATPDNFRDDFGVEVVDGDTYMICERIRELSEKVTGDPHALRIRRRIRGDGSYYYIVSEICRDKVERWVLRASALDGRIIARLEYMLHVPYEHRFKEAEKIEAKYEAELKEAQLDKLYETMGAPMLPKLEQCGFITRPRSYPKRGTTGGKGSHFKQ